MALLKGGKGGGSSTTNISSEPDKAYNARMAKVTERQQALSDQFFNWWQTVQAPVEQANADAQPGLIPAQTDIVREGLEGFKGIQTDPCYIVIIAGFVTIVQMFMQAYMESLYNALGGITLT